MNGHHMNDFYKRHHEIVSFLDGVGIPDVKAVKLAQLYQNLKVKGEFEEKRQYRRKIVYGEQKDVIDGNHFIYLPTATIFHYECAHKQEELGENERFGYPQAFEDLKSTPWFHNQ